VNPLERFMHPLLPRAEYDAVPNPAPAAGPAGNAAKLIDNAKKFIGTPYKWGGSSPLGFDCSGFTQYVFKQMGVDLPRVSYQQGTSGAAVAGGAWQPGDLIFSDNSPRNPGADHVMLYMGNNQIIEAPKPGTPVRIRTLTDAQMKSMWARRYL
jgi:cell wall-associated NlpC family hydrolase